jgi:RNA polymerase sigma factor (sigma-70 family)
VDPLASALVEEHYRHAINFARAVFPREDDIDGVATENLCRAATEWVEGEYQGKFWPWAMGYLRYKLYDWWRLEYGRHYSSRKRMRLNEIPIDSAVHARGRNRSGEPLTIVDLIPADVVDPEEHAVGVLQAEFITRTIKRRMFSDTERGAMELRSQGLSLKEIGAEFGVTESRACQILTRAKRKLEAYMEM